MYIPVRGVTIHLNYYRELTPPYGLHALTVYFKQIELFALREILISEKAAGGFTHQIRFIIAR